MLNKRTNGRTKNYNHCLPFIERMEIEKLIEGMGLLLKRIKIKNKRRMGTLK